MLYAQPFSSRQINLHKVSLHNFHRPDILPSNRMHTVYHLDTKLHSHCPANQVSMSSLDIGGEGAIFQAVGKREEGALMEGLRA